jgi:hypothetical protein
MVITAIATALFKTPLDLLLKIWICPVYEEEDLQRTMKVHPLLPKAGNNGFIPVHHDGEAGSWKIPYMGFKHWWYYLIRLKNRRFLKSLLSGGGSVPGNSDRTDEKQPAEDQDVDEDEDDDEIHNFGRAIPSAVISTHHAAHRNLSAVENVFTVTTETKHKTGRKSMLAKKKESAVVVADTAIDLEKGKPTVDHNNFEVEDKLNPYINSLCENILKHQLTLSKQVHRRKSVVASAGTVFPVEPSAPRTEGERPAEPTSGNNHLTARKKSLVQVQQEQDRLVQLYQDQWGIKEETVQLIPAMLSGPQQLEAFDADAIANYSAFYSKSQKALAKLQPIILRSNSVTAGMELMNLFIIDLLGFTTRSARIFRNKFNEDYEEMFLVTRVVKYLCVLCVFGLNAFFLWYLLLRAVYKGHSWQWQFLKVIISQILIEIILMESIECLSLHYLIPESVRHDVKKAVHVLQLIAENIDTLIVAQQKQQQQQISSASAEFDSTSYFFLSKALTKLRPELLETYIIDAYNNPFPGMICHTWSHYKRRSKLHPDSIQNGEQDTHQEATRNNPQKPFVDFFHNSVAPVSSNDSHQKKPSSSSSSNNAELEEAQNSNNSLWNKCFAPNSYLFLVVTALANASIYCLQSLGVMPMASQKVIVRALQSAVLSGLTILWYTAQTQNALFAVFTVVIFAIILFFLVRNSYKQRAKADAMINDENLIDELQEEKAVVAATTAAAVVGDNDVKSFDNGHDDDHDDDDHDIDGMFHGENFSDDDDNLEMVEQHDGGHHEDHDDDNHLKMSVVVAQDAEENYREQEKPFLLPHPEQEKEKEDSFWVLR